MMWRDSCHTLLFSQDIEMSLQNIKTQSKASARDRTFVDITIIYHEHVPTNFVLNENQMIIESVGINVNPIDIKNY